MTPMETPDVPPDVLPPPDAPPTGATGATPWRRLHPLTLVHNLADGLPTLLLLLAPLLLGTGNRGRVLGGLAFAATSLVVFGPVVVGQYLRFRYRLTDEGVEVESGLFSRQHRLVPYDRMQAVEVERPLLARLLGTARVRLMTGSGQGAEATLAVVRVDEAERLRRRLLDARTAGPASETVPLGTPAQAASAAATGSADAVRFVLTTPRLVRAGLYRLSLAALAAVFPLLQLFDLDPVDLFDLVRDGHFGGTLRTSVEAHPAASAAFALALALLIAWMAGFATTVLRVAGFTLTDDGARLHARAGLLSQWTRTLPRRRVQAFVRRSHVLMRRAGFVRLDAQMLGASGEATGSSLAPLAPLATVDEADALVDAVRPLAPVEAWRPSSPRHARRLAIRHGVPAVVVPLGVGALVPGSVAANGLGVGAVVAAVLGTLAVVLARAKARAHRHALTGDALHVESGALWRVRRSVPRDRVQGLSVVATVMQRRQGLASVVVDTAAGPALGLRVRDLAAADARLLADALRFGQTLPGSDRGVLAGAADVAGAVADEAEIQHRGHGLAERGPGEVEHGPADR